MGCPSDAAFPETVFWEWKCHVPVGRGAPHGTDGWFTQIKYHLHLLLAFNHSLSSETCKPPLQTVIHPSYRPRNWALIAKYCLPTRHVSKVQKET